MKHNWIEIKDFAPDQKSNAMIMVWTPDKTVEYRIVHCTELKRLTAATHWQPCLPPLNEKAL